MTQLLKNLLAMRETWVQSLGWEDALEKGTVTHSSIWPGVPWSVSSMGAQRGGLTEQLKTTTKKCEL